MGNLEYGCTVVHSVTDLRYGNHYPITFTNHQSAIASDLHPLLLLNQTEIARIPSPIQQITKSSLIIGHSLTILSLYPASTRQCRAKVLNIYFTQIPNLPHRNLSRSHHCNQWWHGKDSTILKQNVLEYRSHRLGIVGMDNGFSGPLFGTHSFSKVTSILPSNGISTIAG